MITALSILRHSSAEGGGATGVCGSYREYRSGTWKRRKRRKMASAKMRPIYFWFWYVGSKDGELAVCVGQPFGKKFRIYIHTYYT